MFSTSQIMYAAVMSLVKPFEVCNESTKQQLVSELKGNVLKRSRDRYGKYVLQKALLSLRIPI